MPDPGSTPDIISMLDEVMPVVIAPVMRDFSPGMVEQAHARQVMVFVDESQDDPDLLKKEWKMILDLKTDGIQTDYPEMLIEYILQAMKP
jgi:hypothetical protein